MLKSSTWINAALQLLLTTGVVAAADVIPGHDAARKQVLILTGYNSTRNHNWRENAPALRQILETAGFEVRINEEPRALTPEVLAGYDVLVLDYSNYTPALAPPWTPATQEAYLGFLRGGKGVVAFHAACGSFQNWPEYRRSLGIREHNKIGHGPYHTFEVVAKTEHPMAQAVAPRFSLWGEIYNGMVLERDATVIATAFDSAENCTPGRRACGSGVNQPVVWTYGYERGRSVVFTPGHDLQSIQKPEFAKFFVSAVEWAAQPPALQR